MLKNRNRLTVEQTDATNFTVPKGEEHLFHVKIEVPQYDPSTGQKVSIPRIQAFGAKMFRTKLRAELKKIGYVIEILHDPTEFLAAKQEEKKLTREERLRNRIMAELQEAGVLKDPTQKTEEQIREELLAELKAKGMLKEEEPSSKVEGESANKKEKGKKENPSGPQAPGSGNLDLTEGLD